MGILNQLRHTKRENSTRSASQTDEFLMRILRERDPDLNTHVNAVYRSVVKVGRELGLPEQEIEELGRAAKLHDIGKISIPDDILNKQGPLDEIEWELMRRHTLIGERILGTTPALSAVGRLVSSSHERWDGDGYPAGLEGTRIPLGSRIIFISDAFDAMTTGRAYRRAVSEEEALSELRSCAGTQFDPGLVDVFCRLVEDGPAAKPSADGVLVAA